MCVGLAFARSPQSSVPQVLIVQLHDPLIEAASPIKPPIDPNIAVADIFAQAFDDDGRLEPVVWSITDPTFREALTKGKIGTISPDPSLAEAQNAAGKMGWDYVLFVKAVRKGGDVVGQARLYRGRNQVWQDPEPIDREQLAIFKKMLREKRMTQEAVNKAIEQQESRHLNVIAVSDTEAEMQRAEENTAKSLARTWIETLVGGPFKNLPPKRRRNTPTVLPGQNPNPGGTTIVKIPVGGGQVKPPKQGPVIDPKVPPIPTHPNEPPPNNPPTPGSELATLKKNVQSLLASKQTAAAISLVRDAIDASPVDEARRVLLIDVLLKCGLPEQAAKEARQACAILPDKVGLRILAARAWLEAGKPDEAQADLNEAVARDPDSADTRLLLAQISLSRGEVPAALDHLSAGIAKHPIGELYFERAIAYAVAGNGPGAEADLAKATELGLPADAAETRYREAVRSMDAASNRSSDELTKLVQRAQLKRKDPALRVLLEKNASLLATRAAFLEKLPAPAIHKKSHSQRVLALKLLVQSLSDVRSYIETGEEDALSDARLNLGEALRGLVIARSQFDDETGSPVSHVDQF